MNDKAMKIASVASSLRESNHEAYKKMMADMAIQKAVANQRGNDSEYFILSRAENIIEKTVAK